MNVISVKLRRNRVLAACAVAGVVLTLICYVTFNMASNAQVMSLFQIVLPGESISDIDQAITRSRLTFIKLQKYRDGVVRISGPLSLGATNLVIIIKSVNGQAQQIILARADEPETPIVIKELPSGSLRADGVGP